MGKRTEHAPGTFSWADVATSDTAAAKAFYSGIFGWEFEDMPTGDEPDAPVYSMARIDGDYVAAVSPQQPQEQDMGVPPHWNNYVTVASADETASKAGELGANVVAPPFDVMTVGRMAVFMDPQGAALCIWEPREHIGAQLVNAPGALTWNELHVPDIDAATSFYGDLFGWTFDAMDTGGGPAYTVIQNGERSNGGIMNTQVKEPANWLPYFAADSLEDTTAKVKDSGGQLHAGPIPMPQGQIAVCADPQNAFFALWEGELQD